MHQFLVQFRGLFQPVVQPGTINAEQVALLFVDHASALLGGLQLDKLFLKIDRNPQMADFPVESRNLLLPLLLVFFPVLNVSIENLHLFFSS
ncbi:hypothetical protein [Prosthecochloris sp. GSB1]|uniref:hypothetical protein n=1 Tax=Prosthecochloris sp. GSB1 TaxID=281093 RepID=UPI00123772F1|nr:hypothetical protein [Prosthecochloris sp. GSB1]